MSQPLLMLLFHYSTTKKGPKHANLPEDSWIWKRNFIAKSCKDLLKPKTSGWSTSRAHVATLSGPVSKSSKSEESSGWDSHHSPLPRKNLRKSLEPPKKAMESTRKSLEPSTPTASFIPLTLPKPPNPLTPKRLPGRPPRGQRSSAPKSWRARWREHGGAAPRSLSWKQKATRNQKEQKTKDMELWKST